jgi:hypothetical protein
LAIEPARQTGRRVASGTPTHYIGSQEHRFMRAEIVTIVEEIKQSASLLRRHL